MPGRAVLNVVYAMIVDGLDPKQREEIDAAIYGWGEMNDQANKTLFDRRGSEDD